MTAVTSAPPQPVADQAARAEWLVSAGVSGAVCAVLSAAVFAIGFAITAVVDTVPSAGDGSGSTLGDTVWAALSFAGLALLVGVATAAPAGIVLGLLNGWLARAVPPQHSWLAVAVVAVVVGALSTVLLLVPITRTLDFSLLGAVLGAFAAVTAGIHLRREQRKWSRAQAGKDPVG